MTYNPTDCNVEPSQVPLGYVRAAEELGVTVLANTPATGHRASARAASRGSSTPTRRDPDRARRGRGRRLGRGWWPS